MVAHDETSDRVWTPDGIIVLVDWMKPRHFLLALLLVVSVLYPLSMGPAAWIGTKFSPELQESYLPAVAHCL